MVAIVAPRKKNISSGKKYYVYNLTEGFSVSRLLDSIKEAQKHCVKFGRLGSKYRIYECTPVLEAVSPSDLDWS